MSHQHNGTSNKAKTKQEKQFLSDDYPKWEHSVHRSEGDGVSHNREQLRELVALEAYYSAERRGFEPGLELHDWLSAEATVEGKHSMAGIDGEVLGD